MGKIDDLFAMKFILPEHNAALIDLAYEKTLVPKTTLEYDEIAEINYKLTDSKRYSIPVTVRYWRKVKSGSERELGEVLTVSGVVGDVDTVRREVRIKESDGTWTRVSVRSIVGVE